MRQSSAARAVCLLFFLIGTSMSAMAQDYPREEIDIDLFIQNLFETAEDDAEYEDLYESLFQYYRNPLNLNTATRDDLETLYVLSELQINSLYDYLQTNGKLINIYELQAVPNFDLITIYRLTPFVKVSDIGMAQDARPLWERVKTEENNYFLLRYQRTLEKARGYKEEPESSAQKYLGSPDKVYARYRVAHSNDFSFGFTVEKDAGEQFRWDPGSETYGFDFVSAHATLFNKGRFKSIALGDYQLQFGQGLILNSGFRSGKGAETVATVRKSNLGVRPFTSVLEYNYFRGAAATYEATDNIDVTGFYSNKARDGSLDQIADTSSFFAEDVITALQTTGFHRTQSEIDRKRAVNEQIMGGNVTFTTDNKNLELGATTVHTIYGQRLERDLALYNTYDFTGRTNTTVGLNGNYIWQNFNFFSEVGRSSSGGAGAVVGFLSSLSNRVEFAMLYRNYSRDFNSLYGQGFGEKQNTANERGMYWGLKYRPGKRITFATYYDRFKFPWLSYLADAPSEGFEYLFRVEWRPSKTTIMYAQLREEQKERNQSDNVTPLDYLINTRRRNVILNLDYRTDELISFKSRVQFSDYKQTGSPTSGFAIVQDVNLDLGKWDLSMRYALFQTDTYNDRQYVYEKDVLYAFSFPAYYGKGTRLYLLARYKVSRNVDFWFRIAQTRYRDQDVVGSGQDAIFGSERTDIKAQVRLKF